MTSDKAIELLYLYKDVAASVLPDDFPEANKLGIEALKRHKELTCIVPHIPYPLLPGETKD